MSVSGIGASSYLIDYWELLRRSEAKQNVQAAPSSLDAIVPVGEEATSAQQAVAETTASAAAPERQNLFAEQLAATILEQKQEEEETETTPPAAAKSSAAAISGASGGSSDSASNKITVKSITDGGTRYIVGVRTDENGEEVEVFRIPQGASARKLPIDDTEKSPEMKLLNTSEENTAKTAHSAVLAREARLAYGMNAPSVSTYSTAA